MVYQITALGRNGFNSDITTSRCFLGVNVFCFFYKRRPIMFDNHTIVLF